MPELKWDASLETGNSDIDNDHQYVFCLINTIDAATRCNVHGNVLEKLAELMIMYTSVHFSREQIAQKKVGFEETEEHQKLHREFIARIQAMKISLAETSADPEKHKASVLKFNDLMKDWWFNHINTEDRKMKSYFEEHA